MGVGGGEEVLARGSLMQCTLEVWGALEKSVPMFQGPSSALVVGGADRAEARRRPGIHSL